MRRSLLSKEVFFGRKSEISGHMFGKNFVQKTIVTHCSWPSGDISVLLDCLLDSNKLTHQSLVGFVGDIIIPMLLIWDNADGSRIWVISVSVAEEISTPIHRYFNRRGSAKQLRGVVEHDPHRLVIDPASIVASLIAMVPDGDASFANCGDQSRVSQEK